MRLELIDSIEDCEWLAETHLVPGIGAPRLMFASAVIEGNDDCPDAVELFVSSEPLVTDGCVRLEHCGQCGAYHRAGFDGDCRDDTKRYGR